MGRGSKVESDIRAELYEHTLLEIILQNPAVKAILDSQPFPDGQPWYLASGAIVQNVWNRLTGRAVEDGIKDYDIIYFDSSDLRKETEETHEQRLRSLFSHLGIDIDVTNEAAVHMWFPKKFGVEISPYTSCEDAIDSWNYCAAVGVTKKDGKYSVYAPYGLHETFEMRVRPNKRIFTRGRVYTKVKFMEVSLGCITRNSLG